MVREPVTFGPFTPVHMWPKLTIINQTYLLEIGMAIINQWTGPRKEGGRVSGQLLRPV